MKLFRRMKLFRDATKESDEGLVKILMGNELFGFLIGLGGGVIIAAWLNNVDGLSLREPWVYLVCIAVAYLFFAYKENTESSVKKELLNRLSQKHNSE